MNLISVLLVDDNSTFSRIASRFIMEQDEEVIVVGTPRGGEEALAQALDLQPRAVLVDLGMPGLSGLETIPRLRKAAPETRIIALTMLDTSEYLKAALAAGADEFVPKAALTTDLPAAIQRAAHDGHLKRDDR